MDLITKRLRLAELTMDELENIHQLHSTPLIDQYNTLGIPADIEVTKGLVNEWLFQQNALTRTSYIFCIKDRESDQFMGLIALSLGKAQFKIADVWYKISPEFWRLGIATEALTELLRFGFSSLGLHRIEAGCAVENTASIKVLEKAGLTREGRKRKVLPIRGEWKDNFFFAILETDFNPSI